MPNRLLMWKWNWVHAFCACSLLLLSSASHSQNTPIANEAYTFKIYGVNDLCFPFVQAFVRTWNHQRLPLQNVNYANIGQMVEGKSYNPKTLDADGKLQYDSYTLENRKEDVRTILVLDCSVFMAGEPVAAARKAKVEFIELK